MEKVMIEMSLDLAMMFSGVSQICSTYWCNWIVPFIHSQYVQNIIFAIYAFPRAFLYSCQQMIKNYLKMMFSGTLVYKKLVANLMIYFLSKFHDIWLSSLKGMHVAISCCKVLALWIFQSSQPTLQDLSYFGWESVQDV